jgi:hypothetical protein
MLAVHPVVQASVIDALNGTFLVAMPSLLKVARYRFRHVLYHDTREDYICETLALCWLWYVQLVLEGRNPASFMTALANYGAKAASCGRRLCGQEKANDLLSELCQRRVVFSVLGQLETGKMNGDGIEQVLRDNSHADPRPGAISLSLSGLEATVVSQESAPC